MTMTAPPPATQWVGTAEELDELPGLSVVVDVVGDAYWLSSCNDETPWRDQEGTPKSHKQVLARGAVALRMPGWDPLRQARQSLENAGFDSSPGEHGWLALPHKATAFGHRRVRLMPAPARGVVLTREHIINGAECPCPASTEVDIEAAIAWLRGSGCAG